MKNERIGAVLAGLLCGAAVAHADSSGIGFGAGQSLDAQAFLSEARARKAPDAPILLAGYVAGNDPQAAKPGQPVEFILIGGGKFTMGTDNGQKQATPIREVAIQDFYISPTLVTVEQYAECVIKGRCETPGTWGYCNWGKKDRQRHPINCVSWKDANDFARFVGGGARLPSEAEYEYAATSRGKNQPYPWGKEEATCDRAVMSGDGGYGCGGDGTMPVCSKPKGNTEQGLCDMVGNVWQWTQDTWHDSYAGAPTDGSARRDADSSRVVRGGSLFDGIADILRADYRSSGISGPRYDSIGFRLARSSR